MKPRRGWSSIPFRAGVSHVFGRVVKNATPVTFTREHTERIIPCRASPICRRRLFVARLLHVGAGAATPTEIIQAWEAGCDIVKIFPASALGGPGSLGPYGTSTSASPASRQRRLMVRRISTVATPSTV